MVVLSVGVLYVAWWVSWERSHPASSTALAVHQGDGSHRLAAIRRLEVIGPQDPEVAVPALIGALTDSEPANRAAAADAVTTVLQAIKMGDADPAPALAAVTALMARLDDPEPTVRVRVATALLAVSMLWPGAPRIVDLELVSEAFAGRADDADVEVRVAAIRGLGQIGQHAVSGDPPPRLVAALADEAPAVRSAASQELCAYRRGLVRLLPALVKTLETARPEHRSDYLSIFQGLSPRHSTDDTARRALPAVVAALGSRDRDVRCRMLAILGQFGPDARPYLPTLLALIDEGGESDANPPRTASTPPGDPVVAAAAALAEVAGGTTIDTPTGPKEMRPVRNVVPRLIALLGSRVPARRLAAINALQAFQPDRDQLAALLPLWRDPDADVRTAAIQALHDNASGRPLLSTEGLFAALEDSAPKVREAAALAAAGCGSRVESMFPALIRHAEHDPDGAVRASCSSALADLAPPDVTKAVVPLCIEALERSGSPTVLRASLVRVLAGVGPGARAAVPALCRILRAAEPGRPREEKPARGFFRTKDLPSPTYAELEADREARDRILLRRGAAEALGRIASGTPEASQAVGGLIGALGDCDEVMMEAVSALTALGSEARPALPALAAALRRSRSEKQPLHAGAIAEAMGRLGPAEPQSAPALAFLREVLGGEDHTGRTQAERILAIFGPSAVAAVPRLVELSRRPILRKSEEIGPLAMALGRIAPGTVEEGPALAALVDLILRDSTAQGSETVIAALARFGPVASAATPRLRELADAREPRIRAAVHQALAAIERPPARPSESLNRPNGLATTARPWPPG